MYSRFLREGRDDRLAITALNAVPLKDLQGERTRSADIWAPPIEAAGSASLPAEAAPPSSANACQSS